MGHVEGRGVYDKLRVAPLVLEGDHVPFDVTVLVLLIGELSKLHLLLKNGTQDCHQVVKHENVCEENMQVQKVGVRLQIWC